VLHLENVYKLHWLSLVMPEDGPDFVVEASKDASHWVQVAEAKGGRKNHEIGLYHHPEGAAFLRIRFPQVTSERPAALSEVKVWARPKP
jgi:beta-galactosidase